MRVLLLLLVLAPLAHAQGVRVERFARDPGDRVHDAIVRELAAQGVPEGNDLVVRGRYRARRNTLNLSIDGRQVRIVNRSRDELARRAVQEIRSALSAPAPAPITADTNVRRESPRESVREPVRERIPEPPRASSAPPDTLAMPPSDMRTSQASLRMWAGAQIYSRTLSYNDDLFTRLASYALTPGFAAHAGFEWYPLRHVSHELWANVGVSGFARGMALDTSYGQSGASYATRAHAWELDLRYSLPIDAHAITLGAAYGQERFGLDPSEPSSVARRQSIAPIPAVDYHYLRPFATAELYLIEGLTVGGSFGWRFLLSSGEIAEWFPRASGTGMDFGIFVAYRVSWFFEVRLTGEHHRYVFGLNPQPGDRYVAGGASDEWMSLTLDATIRLPGAQ